MEKPVFYCEFCGAPVPKHASSCPSCGRVFDAVKCPSCGFEGQAGLFKKGCPSCGYGGAMAARDTTPTEPAKPTRRVKPWFYRLAITILLAALLVILALVVRRL